MKNIEKVLSNDSLGGLIELLPEDITAENLRLHIDQLNLQRLQPAATHISLTEKTIKGISEECEHLEILIAKATARMDLLVPKGDEKSDDLETLEIKMKILDLFTPLFVIPTHVRNRLIASDTTLDQQFMAEVIHILHVIQNAKQLLQVCAQQVLGIQVIAEANDLLATALEKMATALKRTLGISPDVSVWALSLLKEYRPDLYSDTSDLLIARRTVALVKNLEELQVAQEGVFYIAEICSWFHEACEAENDWWTLAHAVSAMAVPQSAMKF